MNRGWRWDRKPFLVVIALLALGFAGCKPSAPDLKMDTLNAVDKTTGGPEVGDQVGKNVTVVTGESATKADGQEETGKTAEDKTGTVAVKVAY